MLGALAKELLAQLNDLCDPAPPGYHPREAAAAASLAVVALCFAIAVRRKTLARAR